jgi:hypothetical protein
MESLIKLQGYSGCGLYIKEDGDKLSVVKVSKNEDYNVRLLRQCEKQANARISGFKAPMILGQGFNDSGLFEFRMEYLNGLTLAEHFRTIRISEIGAIAERFISMIPEVYIYDIEAVTVFKKKIEDLNYTLESKSEQIKNAFLQLSEFDWKFCVRSGCHGDMTFENIIIDNNEVYLIDFLDSFYDSWMIDFAKILQDVECGWSYRYDKEKDENLQVRLSIFLDYIIKRLLSLKDGKYLVLTIYHILLLNLIRILPYTKDTETVEYLDRQIEKISVKIINDLKI